MILCLTHSFSGLDSTETESIQRCRQKLRAPNQSSSLPGWTISECKLNFCSLAPMLNCQSQTLSVLIFPAKPVSFSVRWSLMNDSLSTKGRYRRLENPAIRKLGHAEPSNRCQQNQNFHSEYLRSQFESQNTRGQSHNKLSPINFKSFMLSQWNKKINWQKSKLLHSYI